MKMLENIFENDFRNRFLQLQTINTTVDIENTKKFLWKILKRYFLDFEIRKDKMIKIIQLFM